MDAEEQGLEPETTDVAEAAEAEAPDPFDSGAESFDRGYVEKLRKEAADRRVALKEWEEPFDGVHPDDRKAILDLVRTFREDPTEAAAIFRAWADHLSPAEQRELARNVRDELEDDDEDDDEDDELDQPLTRRELLQMEQEREAQRQAEAEQREVAEKIKAIEDEAEKLGYPPGTRNYVALLWEARENHDGDLAAAAKVLEAEKQQAGQGFLADKASQPNAKPAPRAGTAPSGAQPIRTPEDAERAMKDRLSSIRR